MRQLLINDSRFLFSIKMPKINEEETKTDKKSLSKFYSFVEDIMSVVVKKNEGQLTTKNLNRIFECLGEASIKLKSYFKRVFHYTKHDVKCLVYALAIIDKLILQELIVLNKLNLHSVILTALLLSFKFLEDSPYTNKVYSIILGINLNVLNLFEKEMLEALNYRISIKEEDFMKYVKY